MVVNNREHSTAANIKVVGVGGGGSNAVSRMFRERIPGIEYMVCNTAVSYTHLTLPTIYSV